MMLAARSLLRLPVFTKSGARIGRVSGFEFETETQTIVRYEVRRFVLGTSLLVHRGQVVSIDASRMVVDDLVVPEALRTKLAIRKSVPESAAPLTSQE